jgi:hypothetical protein
MRLPLVVLAVAALVFVSACEPSYPGVPLGTYGVVETLDANTCGAGLPVLATVTFDVELRASGAVGYWRMPASGPIAGSYREADGAFEFRSTLATVAWAADLPNGIAGCTLEQRETIRGTVTPINVSVDGAVSDATVSDGDAAHEIADAGIADASSDTALDGGNGSDAGSSEALELLVGEHTVDIVVVSGSDCAALLTAQGGSFDLMPCRVHYTISGTASDATF